MRWGRACLVVLAAMACVGCGASVLWRRAGGSRPAVAVVVEGSAFRTRARTAEAVRAIEQVTGRPAVLLLDPAARAEAIQLRIAARFPSERRGMADDRREARCAADAPLLAAIDAGGVALYRVALDAETSAGSVTRLPFTAEAPRRVAVARRLPGAPLDVGRALADPLHRLASVPAPRWNDLAERVLWSGCPGVALAIVELRGDKSPATRRTRAAALAAIRQRGATARVRSDLGAAHATVAPEASLPPPSCQTLCELHMVQLCNEDRLLWSYHRTVWEPTACGRRRTEAFLAGCYEDQRASGAFDDACLRPCETSVAARERLEGILASAGCLAAASARAPVSRTPSPQ